MALPEVLFKPFYILIYYYKKIFKIFGGEETWPIAFGFPGISAFLLCCILPFCPESPKVFFIIF
jgi:hypothetical protein